MSSVYLGTTPLSGILSPINSVNLSFGGGKLAAGQSMRGWMSFEIPADTDVLAVYVEAEFFEPKVVIADLTQ